MVRRNPENNIRVTRNVVAMLVATAMVGEIADMVWANAWAQSPSRNTISAKMKNLPVSMG